VRSWGEFTRAGLTRWTGYDHATLEAALTHVENEPRERHYFPIA